MKHVYFPDEKSIDSLALGLEGSAKMAVKLVSDETVVIALEPGGHTPDHTHGDKERLVVLSGEGELEVESGRKKIKPDDFIEFDSGEAHQIINSGEEKLVFFCFRNQK